MPPAANRVILSLGAAAVALALAGPAAAQNQMPSTQELLEQIQKLQRRIDQLEATDKQRQATDARVRAAAAQQPAAQPRPVTASAAPAPGATYGSMEVVPGAAGAPPPNGPPPVPAADPDKPNGSFQLGAVKLTLGGFIDLTGYYRSRNENRGTGTGYATIPFYGPTPQGNTDELGFSAQQTRIATKLEAPVGEYSKLTGYVEVDFNNGAGGANSTQSDSYTPRLRQAFGEYEDSSWGAYFLAGQAWTLATPFKKGLDPFQTWQPPTIDHNYMVGYTYLRVPMIRAVKSLGPVTFGVEANSPQTIFGGNPSVPTGQSVFTSYPGATGLNPQVNYSVNNTPDFVAKIALDLPYGHIDAFGVARWFRDQVAYGTNSVNYSAFSVGFGGSVYIPVTKYADLMGNVMYGNGIGRYGADGLADVTSLQNGSLTTLPQGMGTVGAILHPIPGVLDIYGFYGWNWVGASYFPGGGYGNPTFDNTGCFNANAPASAVCTGNNSQLSEFTAGINWNMLKGRFGTLRSGFQYGNIIRTAYYGTGGSPGAVENLFMFNFRYIPFE